MTQNQYCISHPNEIKQRNSEQNNYPERKQVECYGCVQCRILIFVVLMAVIMRINVLQDAIPCSPVDMLSTLPRLAMPPPTGRKQTLKMEAAGSSETSVYIYHITKCHFTVILCERSWGETTLNSKQALIYNHKYSTPANNSKLKPLHRKWKAYEPRYA
jgi:hypothetical protein